MEFFFSANFGIIWATLLGPVLAVQTQKILEGKRALKERRLFIFRTLMSTRTSNLSPVHVEALNSIPVEFYGSGKELKAINDSWRLYLDHHSVSGGDAEIWNNKRRDLFTDLMYLLSQHLGYSFSKAQIQRDYYSPRVHGNIEADQTYIREALVALLKGEIAIPMAVKEFPPTEAAPEMQELLKLLIESKTQGTHV